MKYKNLEEFKTSSGYDVDGLWYPRVTSIISIKAKPELYRYYGGLPSFAAGEAIKERSALEGQAVHSAVESILKREHAEIPRHIQPAVDAFIEFARHHQINPLKIEERVASKTHRYAGTIDVLAEVDGVVGVLDVKTSQAIYRDYGMQTAAYVEAFKEDPNLPPLTSWILRLDQAQVCNLCGAKMRSKGGNTKIRNNTKSWRNNCQHEWSEVRGEYEFQEVPDFEHNIKAFLGAKALWEWEHHEFLEKI